MSNKKYNIFPLESSDGKHLDLSDIKEICKIPEALKFWENITKDHDIVVDKYCYEKDPPCPSDFLIVKKVYGKKALREIKNNILINELINTGKLSYNYFMYTYDIFKCKKNYFIVAEGISGLTFKNWIDKNKSNDNYEEYLKRIFKQIALAVKQLEKEGLHHIDLHTNNIIVTYNLEIKIIDFEVLWDSKKGNSIKLKNINFLGDFYEEPTPDNLISGLDLYTVYWTILDWHEYTPEYTDFEEPPSISRRLTLMTQKNPILAKVLKQLFFKKGTENEIPNPIWILYNHTRFASPYIKNWDSVREYLNYYNPDKVLKRIKF